MSQWLFQLGSPASTKFCVNHVSEEVVGDTNGIPHDEPIALITTAFVSLASDVAIDVLPHHGVAGQVGLEWVRSRVKGW